MSYASINKSNEMKLNRKKWTEKSSNKNKKFCGINFNRWTLMRRKRKNWRREVRMLTKPNLNLKIWSSKNLMMKNTKLETKTNKRMMMLW